MDDKKIETTSVAISSEEYEAIYGKSFEEINLEQLIDSTIMQSLMGNNIFQNFMPIEELRAKLLDIVKYVIFEDMHEKGCVGYWRSVDGTLAIEERLKDNLDSIEARGTIIHELLHALSTKEVWVNDYKVERWCGIQKNVGYTETGRGLNEGITEYLSQRLCPESKKIYSMGSVSFNISGVYALEQIAIKQIALLYGEDKIIDAYLNNHDIDMPKEQYFEIRTYFDYIDEKESKRRDIHKGRSFGELSETEKKEVLDIDSKIENRFIQSQQFFLENCLMEEIANISTIEQAEAMKEKLKQLNALQIHSYTNEKVNYEKYNFAFIRKYLQIVNQNRSYEKQIKFSEVEAYIVGNSSLEIIPSSTSNTKIEDVMEKISELKIPGIAKLMINLPLMGLNELVNRAKREHEKENNTKENKEQAKFIRIDRGEESPIYVRECGKEIIAGRTLSVYEYFSEQEYEQYQAGDVSKPQTLLRGEIDFGRLKKDKDYEYYLGHYLLTQDRIDEKILNYNGYIGSIGTDYSKHEYPEVQERLEELEKFTRIRPQGYEEDMYIAEVQNLDNPQLGCYILLTKELVEERRRNRGRWPLTIQGNIDLDKISSDPRYRSIVENELLEMGRLEEQFEKFDGYVGEIAWGLNGFQAKVSGEYLEHFASEGINGEEKKKCGYIRNLGQTGEKDSTGADIYEYEIISSEEMQRMWENPQYSDDKRERIVVFGSEMDITLKTRGNRFSYDDIVFNGGYIGNDNLLSDMYELRTYALEDCGAILWEMGGETYISTLGTKEFENRHKIPGNLDITRLNTDLEYREYVLETVFTEETISNIRTISNLEIHENEGEYSFEITEAQPGDSGKSRINNAAQERS